MNENTFPRYLVAALDQRLRVMPAVVVTGARQTGKSTLLRVLMPEKRSYFSLDYMDVFDLARRNPESMVEASVYNRCCLSSAAFNPVKSESLTRSAGERLT